MTRVTLRDDEEAAENGTRQDPSCASLPPLPKRHPLCTAHINGDGTLTTGCAAGHEQADGGSHSPLKVHHIRPRYLMCFHRA
jgi:hypothetical protein